jgi:hypothetical protein
MKSIIRNRKRWIRKNNKSHQLCYSYCEYQENKFHNKKNSIGFQNRYHYYYTYGYNDYRFNGKIIRRWY